MILQHETTRDSGEDASPEIPSERDSIALARFALGDLENWTDESGVSVRILDS